MLPSEAPAVDDDELDLRAYLAVLRRRWTAIVLVTLLAVGAAVGLSVRQEERYRAEADVLIRQRTTESLFTEDPVRNAQDAERQLNNEVRVLESGAIVGAVEVAYDGPLDPDDVEASVSSDTSDVVTVSMTATDPAAAAELVNAYVTTFIEARRQQRVDELLAAGSEIRIQIDELTAELAAVRAPLDAVDAELAADPDDPVLLARRETLASQLAVELTTLEGRRSFYEQQLEDLELTAGITSSGGAQVLTQAEVPEDPVSPRPLRDGAIALVLGLVLGVGIAFLVDNLDERIRGIGDLDRVSGGLPTLAVVPEVEGRTPGNYVATRDDPRSGMAEAFRSLRTAVKFAAIDKPIRVVQVTSPGAGEGKTTTVANLALALSQGGDRVAVVCCDLRRPTVHERFDLSQTPGFTDVLVGDETLSNALRRYEGTLMVLPAGSHAPNPSELLSSERAHNVISALAEQFDIVVVDTPPVLPVTDALVVSRLADATLVVVDARTTRRNGLRRTFQLLGQVNAPVLGTVLNGASSDGGYGYGYGYGYGGYGHEPYGRDVGGRRRGRRRRGIGEPVTTG
jgi:succinoglycan biosynthesis transport protein ExoP